MKKQIGVIGCALLLGACGGQDTRTPVALDSLVVPTTAPWLQVEQKPMDLVVRGLDPSLTLTPAPSVPAVLQAQLRQALQTSYITNLVVTCTDVEARMQLDTDATPNSVTLALSLHCTTNAQGLVSSRDYRAQPAIPAPADGDYRKALVALLATGSADIAGQLNADVLASEGKLRKSPR